MRKKHRAAAALLMLAGLGILLYPGISNGINRWMSTRALRQWTGRAEQLEAQELADRRAQAQAYNDALLEGFEPENYGEILNLGGDILGYIRIPAIELELPIYHGVEEEALRRGAGHLPGSAFPLGRQGDHPVITGHTGFPGARLFTDLIRLREGDLFYIRMPDQELCYEVDRIQAVLPSQGAPLLPVPGEDLCTLVTCTPYGVNSHRLLVRGRRVPSAGAESSSGAAGKDRDRWYWLFLPAAALTAVKHRLDGGRKPLYNGYYLGKKKRRAGKWRPGKDSSAEMP